MNDDQSLRWSIHHDGLPSTKPTRTAIMTSNYTLKRVHKCGTVCEDDMNRCPGCNAPMLVLPEAMVTLAQQFEKHIGLNTSGLSLLGLVVSAYSAGWDDRDTADDQSVAADSDETIAANQAERNQT